MARPDKAASVAEIAGEFRAAGTALLTEYRGLTVAELTELRRSLGEGSSYAIVKNTLTRIAAREAGVAGIDELLQGPTAIAFVRGDPVEAARTVRDFSRAHPLLVVKGGVVDGRLVSPTEITALASLESREVLLARLAGAMTASLSQAVSLFAAPLAQVARLAAALRDQVGAAVGAAELAAEDSVAEPAAEDSSTEQPAEDSATAPTAEDSAPAPAAEDGSTEPTAEAGTTKPTTDQQTDTG